MNNVVAHPRRAAESAKALSRKFEADRTAAVTALERAINLLREIAREPNYGLTNDLRQDHETALRRLQAPDATSPPSAESVLPIGRRPQRAGERFNTNHGQPPAEGAAGHYRRGRPHDRRSPRRYHQSSSTWTAPLRSASSSKRSRPSRSVV